MPAISYDEDTDFSVELDEDDIRQCSDIETLTSWSDDADAVIEDIKCQIEASALAGCAERAWVYRAGKAMGFMARAKSRIRSRLIALGHQPGRAAEVANLQRKLVEAKAREAVAVEFMRLCVEGATGDPEMVHRIEKHAERLVKARDEAARQKADRHAEYQAKVAA